MAKKIGRKAAGGTGGGRLVGFAEELGKFLGTTERQATEWLGQRKAIVQQLTAVRDQANKLLKDLTGGAADVAAAVGVSRGTRGTGRKRGRKKMSAAEKKAVSDRMKKYWADRRAKTSKTATRKKRKKGADSDGHAVGNG